MSLESDMVAAALAVTNIEAQIDDRFYAGEAPQEAARPLVVYLQTNSEGDRTLGGGFWERRARYQWRLICDTYEQVVILKSACRELNGTAYGDIADFNINDGPDGYDFETKRFIKVMDVSISK
jgi:hypothetical protein